MMRLFSEHIALKKAQDFKENDVEVVYAETPMR